MLDSAVGGTPLPERDQFQKIWDRWNALGPTAMATGCIEWNQRHVAQLEALDDATLTTLRVSLFGGTMDAAGLVGMRLGEHATHTWDVQVAAEPTATIPDGATELLIDQRAESIARMARGPKPERTPSRFDVSTTVPSRHWILGITDDEVSLSEIDEEAVDGELRLPAEALLRLAFGRLDAEHTPADVTVRGPVSLDDLRALFPGF